MHLAHNRRYTSFTGPIVTLVKKRDSRYHALARPKGARNGAATEAQEVTLLRIVLVGGGGFGREVLDWLSDTTGRSTDICIGGVLDDNPNVADTLGPCPYLGSTSVYTPRREDRFLLAIGSSHVRLALAAKLEAKGYRFWTLIHPTAQVGSRTIIGEGSIICPRCVITCDCVVGKHNIINVGCTIGHDAVLHDGCTLSPHCCITGYAKVGSGAFLGTGAIIAPEVSVGTFAVVGAGSVAFRNVPDLATVLGVPATRFPN